MISIIQKSAKTPIPYSSGAEKFHEKFKFIAYNKKCYKRYKTFSNSALEKQIKYYFCTAIVSVECENLWNELRGGKIEY